MASDPRFEFGANWRRFLEVVDEDRVQEAERSMRDLLGVDGLAGRRLLDIGCGSGLFSLAALRLGAHLVVSIDVDPESVGCAQELKRRMRPGADEWHIRTGDVTDDGEMQALGRFDVVYAWGVLHHTGSLWTALENACAAVDDGGRLVVSVYNDQGLMSRIWTVVKQTYQRLPAAARVPYAIIVMAPREGRFLLGTLISGRPQDYVYSWTRYRSNRGMSRWHDLLDWVGGWPFEVARPEEIFEFCAGRGFELERLSTAGGGLGCNELVFRRS